MIVIVSFSGSRFIEDVGKKDGFKLIHMVDFGSGQKKGVRTDFWVVLRCFMKDLIRLVSKSIFAVILVERLVKSQMTSRLFQVVLGVVYRTCNR